MMAKLPSAVPPGAGEAQSQVTPAVGAAYVVVAPTDLLSSERVLTGTSRISVVDGGPNAPVTVDAVGAALTRTNDTNVTLTLGGSPNTALVNATSLSLGWTGELSVARGGTGVATLTSNGVLYGNGTGAIQVTAQGAANAVLTANAGAPSFSATPTVTALTTTAALNVGGDLNHDGSHIGFFGTVPAVQQTSGANVTNNVTAGGVNDQIDNWTDLIAYAADAAAIRNAIYQLARKVKQLNDGLRAYGMLT